MTASVENVAPGDRPTATTETAAALPVQPGRLETGVAGVGFFFRFLKLALREIPTALRLYPAEIMRHVGALIRQNSLVILFMLFMLGAVLGLTSHYLFSSIGIDSYIASIASIGGMRGLMQVIFGWIVAAKVGCGIVAELGAMRISEEIDAMEVMGIRSVPYLVSTRIVAGAVVFPLLFIVGMGVNFLAVYLFNVTLLNTVSPGGFVYYLFLFQDVRAFVIAVSWAVLLGLSISLVACYFGYHAKGGPVGVGLNTAKSMLVNLVQVSIVGMMLVQLFYGSDASTPIGN